MGRFTPTIEEQIDVLSARIASTVEAAAAAPVGFRREMLLDKAERLRKEQKRLVARLNPRWSARSRPLGYAPKGGE